MAGCELFTGVGTSLRGVLTIILEILTALCTLMSAEIIGGEYFHPTPSPEFLPTRTNATFRRGELAVLKCTVLNLGTKTVVWRKLDNSFPLTSGTMTVVADDRFQVGHLAFKDQWDLMIKNVQPEDEGLYECQVASKDKHIRRLINLTVLEPDDDQSEIRITEEQYVENGEPIVLQCNATGEYYPPDEMDWFRNGERLSSRSNEGIKIFKKYSLPQRTFTSTLHIDRASRDDDGTYVCRSSSNQITSTKVHVLNAISNNKKRGTPNKIEDSKAQQISESSAPRTFSWISIVYVVIMELVISYL